MSNLFFSEIVARIADYLCWSDFVRVRRVDRRFNDVLIEKLARIKCAFKEAAPEKRVEMLTSRTQLASVFDHELTIFASAQAACELNLEAPLGHDVIDLHEQLRRAPLSSARCIVNAILSVDGSWDRPNNRGYTLFHAAARREHDGAQLIKYLLENVGIKLDAGEVPESVDGARVHVRNKDNLPEHAAGSPSYWNSFKAYHFASEPSNHIDCRDLLGYTALHFAARIGDTQSCLALLAAGANGEARSDHDGQTPWAQALHFEHLDAAEAIRDFGKQRARPRNTLGPTPTSGYPPAKRQRGCIPVGARANSPGR